MIKAEVLDAMVASGCTAEQIAAVVKAAMAASPAGADTPAAARMRRYRQRRVDLGMHYMFEGAKYREALIKRDGDGCVYCGSENGSDVDHMVPIVSGGTDDLDNLAIACRACNGKKSGRTPEEAGMTFANKSAQGEHVRYLGRTERTSSVEANKAADGFSLSPVPLLPPIPPNNPLTPKPSSKINKRGHRLPEDWTMSGPDLAYALSKNLSEREAIDLFERFCSWAWAASGPNALKANWHQAWQGWVQRDGPKIIAARAGGQRSQGPPPGKGGFVSVLMDKHRERQDGTVDFETTDRGDFGFASG